MTGVAGLRSEAWLAAIFAVLSTSTARAEVYADVEGWVVIRGEDSCGATKNYDGPGNSMFAFVEFANGDQTVELGNRNWSAVDHTDYAVSFALDDTKFENLASKGLVSGDRKGFTTSLPSGFRVALGRASMLRAYLNGQLIDRLELTGSAAALASIQRCLGEVRQALAADQREQQRKQQRWGDLPTDPSAKAAHGPILHEGGVARILANYPTRPGGGEWRGGKVEFSARVNTEGRATDCRVTQSSGQPYLDQAACGGVERYLRFEPATNSNGERVESEYSSSVNYEM